MRRSILFMTLIIISLFFNIPDYVELNNLDIIEGIGVSYKDDHYTVYLREIIPIKDDQGINYKYQYYYDDANTLENAYKKIVKKTRKKIYLDKTRFIITNLDTSDKIKKDLRIKCKKIYHTKNNIYKKLKETS